VAQFSVGANSRVLSGRRELNVDASHSRIPLIDYAEVTVRGHRSIGGILRQLASPEVAAGTVRISEADLPAECARWLRLCGICFFGVDELQFLAQSERASTLITRVLLLLAEIGIPWMAIANFSLCSKLLRRPSEAMQRLLSRPVILLPDGPDSKDWGLLLDEYEVVLEGHLGFKPAKQKRPLWNLTAGNKRELAKLLAESYRRTRLDNRSVVGWSDVTAAYASKEFFAARRDVELLVAHAAQGGALRDDLLCPFEGTAESTSVSEYVDNLREIRAAKVATAVTEASMTATELKATAGLTELFSDEPPKKAGNVIPIRKRKPKTLESLQAAGRRRLTTLSDRADSGEKSDLPK